MFPLSETGIFSGVLPAQHPSVQVWWLPSWKICLRNEDTTWLWFLRPCSQGLRQLFLKVGVTIENNILEVSVDGFVSLILQYGDIDKIPTKTNGRCESGRHFKVEYQHHLGPWMGGIVGKTYQTYSSLPPCQEIDISRHKLSQNDNFVSNYPSLVAAVLKPHFRDHMTPIFQPTPIWDPGPQSS